MILDRTLGLICMLWVVLVALISPLAVATGYLDIAKYILVILFLGGAACSVAGFVKYLPAGPKAPALLILSIEKKSVDALLGVAFLVSVLLQPSNPDISIPLLITYSFFGAAGAVSSFLGVYLYIGAGRGWIGRMVYKTPFHKGMSRNSRKKRR